MPRGVIHFPSTNDKAALGNNQQPLHVEIPVGQPLHKGGSDNQISPITMEDDYFLYDNKDGTKDLSSLEEMTLRSRHWLLVLTGLYIFLFVGAVFGFGPMQLMLEEDGVYASQCTIEEQENGIICDDQTIALVNIPFIAGLCSIFSPYLGKIGDHYGSSVLMHVAGILGCLGVGMTIISSATGIDQLFYVAFSLLYLMLMAGCIMISKTGLVFEGDTRRRVISVLNSLLDSGSVTYLILFKVKSITGASYVEIMSGYLLVAVIVFSASSYVWNYLARMDWEVHPSAAVRSSISKNGKGISTDVASSVSTSAKLETGVGGQATNGNPECYCGKNPNSDYVMIRYRDSKGQLGSRMFIFLTIFYTFHGIRNIFTLTTARDFLGYLGDDEVDNRYLSIFVWLTPASLLGQSLIDYVLGNYGYIVGLQVVNALGLLQGIIQVSSNNLNIQIIGFLAFSFYRGFLFSVVFSFLVTFLSHDTVGKATGSMSAITAVVKFVNVPIANWAINVLGGDFFWPNLVYTICIVPLFFVVWGIGEDKTKEKQAEEFVCDQCLRKQVDEGLQINESNSNTVLNELPTNLKYTNFAPRGMTFCHGISCNAFL